MKTPRVLVVSDRYPPLSAGGYETACYMVSERLRANGVELIVLAGNSGGGSVDAAQPHVQRVLHQRKDSPSLLQLARWEREDHRTLAWTIETWKPDVIYLWSLFQLFPSLVPAIAARHVPAIFNIQDLWLPTFDEHGRALAAAWAGRGGPFPVPLVKDLRHWCAKPFVPALQQHPHPATTNLRGTIFCSGFRQRQHAAAGFDTTGSRVIYNGIDCQRFVPAAQPPHPQPLRALAVGRLVEEKGFQTAIDAMARLAAAGRRDVTLTIAGYESYPQSHGRALKASVTGQGLGELVSFIDPVPYDRMPALLQQHHALVFPSTGPEGLPMSVLEAMSCGLCVVGTQTGGSAEILDDEHGRVFVPGDATRLAELLAGLADQPASATEIGARAREMVVRRFDVSTIADETLQHLQHVAAQGCA
jgi:glycosyltransferase involved in cell wall biosynthesis